MINCIRGMCFQFNPPVLTSPQDTLLGERSEYGWDKKIHNWKPCDIFSKDLLEPNLWESWIPDDIRSNLRSLFLMKILWCLFLVLIVTLMSPSCHKCFAKIRVEFRGCFLVGENISSNKRDNTFKSVSRSWHLNRQMSNFSNRISTKCFPLVKKGNSYRLRAFHFYVGLPRGIPPAPIHCQATRFTWFSS